MNTEAMGILPRFSHTSGADLEAHHVPPHVIEFVEQHRDHLQRAAQDQNGFRAGLTSTKSGPLDNRTQVNHASSLQVARPPQFMPGQQQLQQLQRQGQVPGPVKPNTLPPGQSFNNVGPSTAQSMGASSVPPMGAQITVSNSSGGVQNQGGSMSVSMNAAAMNNFTPGSIQSLRRPTQEELINAKRYVDEKKKVAFSSGEFSLPRLSRL